MTEAPVFVKAQPHSEFWTDERCYITEVCNTDQLPGASLALARVEAGVTTQLHSLTGITETYIVQSGEGRLEVGGEVLDISEGDQVVIPPGCPQRVTAVDEELRFLCLCIPRFVPESYLSLED